jgi:hypothetical protein
LLDLIDLVGQVLQSDIEVLSALNHGHVFSSFEKVKLRQNLVDFNCLMVKVLVDPMCNRVKLSFHFKSFCLHASSSDSELSLNVSELICKSGDGRN